MQVGEVLRIDDVVTGFDDNKRQRPCMIVRVVERPRPGVWVVPRTTEGSEGTFSPRCALPELDQEGRFMYVPRFVGRADLPGTRSIGVLAAEQVADVLANVNDVVIDLEIEL